MPVYEYKCPNEHVQIFTESIQVEHKAPEKCDKCDENVVRLFGTPSVRFKGTGWGKD